MAKTHTLKMLQAEVSQAGDTDQEHYWRPRTRGDCADVPRPCPFAGCKYHLLLHVKPNGNLVFNHTHDDPLALPAAFSCALDVADRGSHKLETVAAAMSVTRERARQIEDQALKHFMYPWLGAELAERDTLVG